MKRQKQEKDAYSDVVRVIFDLLNRNLIVDSETEYVS